VERVRIIVPDFGGGFGGKHTGDVAIEAARLAHGTGRPVKVAWTRAEEFQWAYLRPPAIIDVRATATHTGELTGWEFTNICSGAAGLLTPYDIPNRSEHYQPAHSPLPRGSYRALAATANHFARESHMDDLAAAVGADPIELRRRHLSDPRLIAVLDAVAERVDWARRPGLGIACGVEKDARVATVAEVSVDDSAEDSPRLLRIVTAVDCGAVIDPDGLRLQVVGATIMGLGGALFEAIHFDGGRVRNASLAGYRVPRFSDIPPIDVIVVDRPDITPAGAGETPIVTIAAAIGNAIHAATGKRLRAMPLGPL
jgi:isoquinoline 1-oxidoreductase